MRFDGHYDAHADIAWLRFAADGPRPGHRRAGGTSVSGAGVDDLIAR
jgi:hypothetical protein